MNTTTLRTITAIKSLFGLFTLANACLDMEFRGRRYLGWKLKVDLSGLKVSPVRQRPLNRKWVREIADNFNPCLVRIVLALRPDGTLFVVGGQHCWAAALSVGITEWECEVYYVEDEIEECHLYWSLNLSKKPKAAEEFNYDLFVDNGIAKKLVATLASGGRTWDENAGGWRHCKNIKGLTKLYDAVGERAMGVGLLMGTRAWENLPGGNSNEANHALTYLALLWRANNGDGQFFPTEEVTAFLKTVDPKNLRQQAQESDPEWATEVRSQGNMFQVGKRVAKWLADRYNAGNFGPKLTATE